MKRILALVITIASCALMLLSQPALAQNQLREYEGKLRKVNQRIGGQYIVVFNDDLPGGQVAAAAAKLERLYGGTTEYLYRHSIKGFSIRLTEEAAIALSKNPLVKYVEEDSEVFPTGIQFNPPPGLDRIDQRDRPTNGYYLYNSSPSGGGAGVNVYVIDTGIRPTHQDFGGRAFIARDFVGDGRNGNDCDGHGTHVAGTIGGSMYGVAKRARLYAVRIFGCGTSSPSSRTIAAVDWVTGNHIKPAVTNMSLGGGVNTSLDAAVRRSIGAGVTYAIAAGNESQNAGNVSPARVAEAITVGATDVYDNRAHFSNFGSVLDLFAPGVEITSAWWDSDGATRTISGTSMATPHVAGFAALYLGVYPSASPSTVGQAVVNNATLDKVIDPGFGSPNRLLHAFFPAPNPIDDSRQFVRQQYLDFFLREPDPSGWDFWTSQITQCGSDAACIDRKRVDVSRAFWFSGEFQNRADVRASGLVVAPGANHPFDNRQFVRWCYLTYLQREPDQGGWDFWTNELVRDLANDLGQSGYNHLIRAFLVSLEYRVRFGQPDSPPPPLPSCDINEEQSCYNNGGSWDPSTCSCSYPPPCQYCY